MSALTGTEAKTHLKEYHPVQPSGRQASRENRYSRFRHLVVGNHVFTAGLSLLTEARFLAEREGLELVLRKSEGMK